MEDFRRGRHDPSPGDLQGRRDDQVGLFLFALLVVIKRSFRTFRLGEEFDNTNDFYEGPEVGFNPTTILLNLLYHSWCQLSIPQPALRLEILQEAMMTRVKHELTISTMSTLSTISTMSTMI